MTQKNDVVTQIPSPRFKIIIEKGAPRGDLFELEQKTYYKIIDQSTDEVILVFEELMEASLSRDNGQWDNYQFTGADEVQVAADECSVLVRYHDGREETILLPK